ncbi:MAG: MmgE/PrpD family protein [Oscillospiraceae bacterium]|nr:MmgE/PrpD family protein [Oscillospiraceae bacterium]
MNFTTDYRLENYILQTRWEDLPEQVKDRLKGCAVDLFGALLVGSRSRQFEAGLKLANSLFGKGDIPVIGAPDKLCFAGAATAMGHSSNAYDIDDGHNLTRAHPGTSFVGAVLAAAYEKDVSRNAFLTALLVAYETTVRMGAALMDYYQYAHSSGTFGAVGVAAGVGRLYGFTREQLNNALSVAEFNAPLVPGIRSVEYPSMNKDGVPFGVMTGVLAVLDTLCGFTGNKHMLEADEYRSYCDDLGQKYQVMDLYFKPYPCCRWAHPAIDACTGLMKENDLKPEDIEKVTVYTFKRATMLSKIVPRTADEAQYNIAWPVAASLIYGDFGMEQVREENLGEPRVVEMMQKLRFAVDDALDARFPAERICRAEILTKDGRKLVSPECEPRGEAKENIGVDWLCDKFRRITAPVLTRKGQETLIDLLTGEENVSVRTIVDTANQEMAV